MIRTNNVTLFYQKIVFYENYVLKKKRKNSKKKIYIAVDNKRYQSVLIVYF